MAVRMIPIRHLSDVEIARFWSYVNRIDQESCWIWTGHRLRTGYGRFGIDGTPTLSHRISYFLSSGEDPGPMKVLHRCDNRPCCNPSHLFLGTQADNIRDMFAKGRGNRATGDRAGLRVHPERAPMGSRNASAKLTEEIVAAIRSRYDLGGVTAATIARELGVSPGAIERIVNRSTWRHVN